MSVLPKLITGRVRLLPLIETKTESLPVMNGRQRLVYWGFVLLWFAANFQFWNYWLADPGSRGNIILFTFISSAMFYESTLLPSFYLFFLGWMRKPKPMPIENTVTKGRIKKVAMVTLTVPGSESLEIVKRQLIAMAQVEFAHDNWILVDRCHSEEIKRMAEELGVKYFSRHDVQTWGADKVSRWNQTQPPFKAKTKAGNVNSWLETYGNQYSHFVQLDIDHVPSKDYLTATLGFFMDPKVAWVQSPSVYGNLNSWTARGSAEQELVLQGPLQMGYFGFCQTPFIIGSHCAYDIQAILEIGGFQPTRAEDHLDTVILASRGYKGVFVPEVIAVGDGPENFETYIAQQFAWAFSMIQVLFHHTPRCVRSYTLRQAFQFLFVQTWYSLWSLTMMGLFLVPILALTLNQPVAHILFGDFILRFSPLPITALLVWRWSRRWQNPKGVSLSWRGIVLHIARWPIVLSAFVQVILKVEKPYMITVKGMQKGKDRPFSITMHLPYLALVSLSLAACAAYLSLVGHSSVQGNLLYALQGAFFILLVYAIALLYDTADMAKEGISLMHGIWLRIRPFTVLVVLLAAFISTSVMSAPKIYEAVSFHKENQKEEILNTDSTIGFTTVVPQPIAIPERMFLGMYDPERAFETTPLDVEMEFINWEKSEDISRFIENAQRLGRVPMVTIEPFTTTSGNPSEVLSDTTGALNDAFIKSNALAVKEYDPQIVFIRFAHEMELTNYPWAQSNPSQYIEAYRHYHDIFDALGTTNVRWIWSPAGNKEAQDYYPGDEYVDFIGVTVLGYKKWDLEYFPQARSFDELFSDKFEYMGIYGKQIIITELGVSENGNTNEQYQTSWLKDALSSFGKYPSLKGVVYFNSMNAPNAWKEDVPDWRIITPSSFWNPEDMPR
ncbi:hypothetical protein C4559_02170 [Candidatus Microgenomates bacterium]|nr:MAG: hypothetical protein C4559_02170 [Candidatus Microgenomates bacterium]